MKHLRLTLVLIILLTASGGAWKCANKACTSQYKSLTEIEWEFLKCMKVKQDFDICKDSILILVKQGKLSGDAVVFSVKD